MRSSHALDHKIIQNYDRGGLLARLARFVSKLPPGTPAPEQLAGIDQFHTGGLDATVRVGGLLGLPQGAAILDIGSGLGGPARIFATRFGLRVHGIDMTPVYVEAARYLTDYAGVKGVSFAVGNALDIEAADATYDGATLMHVAMNIEDRHRLYAEIARVLKPGGSFVSYDVVKVAGEPAYPTPWASESDTSFLLTSDETVNAMERAGFSIGLSETDSQRAAASFAQFNPSAPPPLAQVLNVPDFATRIRNIAGSLTSGHGAILTVSARRTNAAK